MHRGLTGVVALGAVAVACSSFEPSAPFTPLPAGFVAGEVTSEDGSRAPQVRLTLEQGSATLAAGTDAGGVYSFPAVVAGVWTLTLGALPSNWSLAPGQAERRLVTVGEGTTSREDFVLVRQP